MDATGPVWNLRTRDQVLSPITSELAMDDREKQLQRRLERERARRGFETAELREERLRKRQCVPRVVLYTVL